MTVPRYRRQAFSEALDYLAYRVEVCRAGLEQYEASHGPTSRAASTERSALFEAQLIKRDIGQMGLMQTRSRELKKLKADRADYMATRPSQKETGK